MHFRGPCVYGLLAGWVLTVSVSNCILRHMCGCVSVYVGVFVGERERARGRKGWFAALSGSRA